MQRKAWEKLKKFDHLSLAHYAPLTCAIASGIFSRVRQKIERNFSKIRGGLPFLRGGGMWVVGAGSWVARLVVLLFSVQLEDVVAAFLLVV